MTNGRVLGFIFFSFLGHLLSASSTQYNFHRTLQSFPQRRELTQEDTIEGGQEGELEVDFEVDFELEEEAEGPTEEAPCVPELGYWRPGGTYNDPTTLITSTPVECCDICREEDRCVTWSRERSTGACALKDRRAPLVENALYDSGFPAGVRAAEMTTLTRCFMERGLRYPRGVVLRRTRTRNGRACCNLCRQNVDCFSWFRNGSSGVCVLNRNVPPSREASNAFTGSALI